MPFSIFRIKTVAGANAAGLILGTATFSMFLMLTLYMQQVLGFSPIQDRCGVSRGRRLGDRVVGGRGALVTQVGVKPVLVAVWRCSTAGLAYFTQVSPDGSYVGDLLPGFLVIALGMGFSFVPISIAALAGVEAAEAGLASGPDQQLAADRQRARDRRAVRDRSRATADAPRAGERPTGADDGFHAAFWVGAAIAAAGVVTSLLLVRRDELERTSPDLVPVPA